MRAVLRNVSFAIKLVGNAGFCNRTDINFRFDNNMQVQLGNEWDVSQLPWGRLDKIGMVIPSGCLTMWDLSANIEGDELIIEAQRGGWTGKQMGLLKGMCGYGVFDAQITVVEQGTYMLPEDLPGIYAPRTLDFSLENAPHYVAWDVYRDRHLRHLCMFGGKEAHEDASLIAEILRMPADDRSVEEARNLEIWWTGIRSRASLAQDELISYAMEYAGKRKIEQGGFSIPANETVAVALSLEEGTPIYRDWVHYGDKAFEFFVVGGVTIDARMLGDHLPLLKDLFKEEGARRRKFKRTRPIFEDPDIQAEWDSEEEDYSLDDDADYDEDYAIEVED